MVSARTPALGALGSVCAASLLLLSAFGGASADERLFDTSVSFVTGSYPEGYYPYAGKVADLNGDGAPDYVCSNFWFSRNVSVLMNDALDGFLAPSFFAIDDGSVGVEVADFTADGLPDIVAANTGSNYQGSTVALLRNLGGGTFAPRQTFAAAPGPGALAAADFNGDGFIDLAVAGYGHLGQGTTVALLRNDGLGGFLAPVSLTVGPGPSDLEFGDLNARRPAGPGGRERESKAHGADERGRREFRHPG